MADKNSDIFAAAIQSGIVVESHLDRCGTTPEGVVFCYLCFSAILADKPPKLGHVNLVKITCCHEFPAVLDDLTLVEEAVIARAHPAISILKLRPAG